jgi:hypothetical protein
VTERAAAGLTTPTGGAVPHASTFGGNPLATAAAAAVLEMIEADDLLGAVTQAGRAPRRGKLGELVAKLPGRALEARGRGLLRGLAVAGNPSRSVGKCRELGLLASLAGANVVRFAPPYLVETAELDEAVAILARARRGAGVVTDFITLADVDRAADRAHRRQRGVEGGAARTAPAPWLAGRHVAIVMEKASTRTRVSFEVAVRELGGQVTILTSDGTQLARGEPIEDTARVLSRYAHAIVFRTFGAERLMRMATAATCR